MPIPLGVLAVAGAGGGAAGAYDLLETTILTTNTASVTFSSLGSYSAYKHLQLRYTARVDVSSTSFEVDLFARINGVTTAGSYRKHQLRGNGSSVSSESASEDLLRFGGVPADGQTSTNQFGPGIIDILDFNSTNKLKTIRWFGGQVIFYASSTLDGYVQLVSGALQSTNAITSIQLFVNDNFVPGSRFSLYGIK
jgi:hypothetical protein